MNWHAFGRKSLVKFLILLGVLSGYFAYLSAKYDFATGGIVSLLTWSFFVLCTPVADGGFLLDFPLRLLFGVRMIVSELFVWAFAITINVVSLRFFAADYDKALLTSLLKKILTTPYPYWAIILLSGVGTFLSLWFGDEVADEVNDGKGGVLQRIRWKKLLAMAVVFALIVAVYTRLLVSLGIEFKALAGF